MGPFLSLPLITDDRTNGASQKNAVFWSGPLVQKNEFFWQNHERKERKAFFSILILETKKKNYTNVKYFNTEIPKSTFLKYIVWWNFGTKFKWFLNQLSFCRLKCGPNEVL